MGLIAAGVIDQIKASADLAEIVGRYVELRQVGRDIKACCPFHEEKTPSFIVHTQGRYEGMFKCFGCGVGGDIIEFIKRIERVEFTDAVRLLAERLGIPIEEEGGSSGAERGFKSTVFKVLGRAAELYQEVLWSRTSLGENVRGYLKERGFTREFVKSFNIGAQPPEWDWLAGRLQREGFSVEILLAAGLVKERQRGGGCYDFLKKEARIVFPIRDHQGRVVALAGRILPGGEGPKYLNSAESLVYQKRGVLYGLDKAWNHRDRPKRLVLMEGYTDVILAHQAGFPGAVGACGTAFGEEHCKLLRRFGGGLQLLFDGDEAGENAVLRSFEVLVAEGIDGEVVVLPDGMDPADLISRRGPQEFAQALEQARPILDFALEVCRKQAGEGAGAVRVAERFLPIVAKAPDRLRREALARQTASGLGLTAAAVVEQVESLASKQSKQQARRSRKRAEFQSVQSDQKGPPSPVGAAAGEKRDEPPSVLDRSVAQLMVLVPGALLDAIPGLSSGHEVEHRQCRLIVRVAAELFMKHGSCSPAEVLGALPEVEREGCVGLLLRERQEDQHVLEAEALDLAARLREKARKERLRKLREQMVAAQREGDQERVEELFRRLAECARELA